MDKKITIIMPNYNYAHYIRGAIDSTLRQTYKNWELVVVDDGSTDNSVQIIREYANKYPDKIELFTHPNREHRNLSQTYQLALKKVTGDYIAFLESDDMWYEDSLAVKADILEKHKDVIVVYTDIELLGDSGPKINNVKKAIRKLRKINNINKNKPFYALELLMVNIIPTFSAAMARKGIFDGLNFSKEYEAWLDWWLWGQLSVKGKFYYIPGRKTKWRVHEKSNNTRYQLRINNIERHTKLFRKKLNICIARSFKKEK